MKQFLPVLLLLACLGAAAQTRTYSDNASNTFIFGLENYFFGASGSLHFQVGGLSVEASVNQGTVSVDATVLSSGEGDTIIGIHDFTGNREPELVVARRSEQDVSATVFSFSGNAWKQVGYMTAPDSREIRVFRQVISIRSGETLHSWTWHGAQFDYKSSR